MDDYVFNRAHWIADLDNGEQILQDDERPGIEERSAWKRLREYCRRNNRKITKFWIRFRSHIETPVPDNAHGYYFRHGSVGMVGLQGNWRDGTTEALSFFLMGYVSREDGQLHVQFWKVPELQKAPFLEGGFEEIRPIDDSIRDGSLIWNLPIV